MHPLESNDKLYKIQINQHSLQHKGVKMSFITSHEIITKTSVHDII